MPVAFHEKTFFFKEGKLPTRKEAEAIKQRFSIAKNEKFLIITNKQKTHARWVVLKIEGKPRFDVIIDALNELKEE